MTVRIVLCGSGEFTPAMADVDREILAGLRPRARVAIVPTAAGLEETPTMWARMGSEHFRALGAEPVPIMVVDRAGAEDPRNSDAIADVDWVYLSGGNPGHLVASLAGTPFWSAVLARLREGAILAGSSAGAMALGETTFVPLGRGPDGLPTDVTSRPAFAVVPGVIVAPHFDILPEAILTLWDRLVPRGHRLLGIDEDTALVGSEHGWSVRGRGRVLVFGGVEPRVFRAGAALDGLLPPPLAYTQTT